MQSIFSAFSCWLLDQHTLILLSPSVDCTASCLFDEEVKITEESNAEWCYNATKVALKVPSDTKLSFDSLLISLY